MEIVEALSGDALAKEHLGMYQTTGHSVLYLVGTRDAPLKR